MMQAPTWPRNGNMPLHITFNGTTWHVERAVSVWRREKRLQALEQENERHAMRELSWYYDDEGFIAQHVGHYLEHQGAISTAAISPPAAWMPILNYR